jgi:hypothetical protein
MTAVLLLFLLPVAADRCLPGDAGFLSMRLRGSIEAEIHWREPELTCNGMPRPDGRGLRLHFAGKRDDGDLSVVFAAPELGMGISAKGVPVNVTLLDGAGERIYGTRGVHGCQFDEIKQEPLEDPGLPPASYRVSGRGFCTVPAPAVDGDGSVLVTRFDFAGMISYGGDQGAAADAEDASLPPWLAELDQGDVEITTATGRNRFRVWIADNDAARARGLMHVEKLPDHQGMLFVFNPPQFASFWMKNTYVPLDLVFIGPDGRVVTIARDARPFSLAPIESVAPVKAVLELAGGTAARIGLAVEDRVKHPEQRGGERGTETESQMPAKPTFRPQQH